MDPVLKAKSGTYAGVFLVALATLMFEILLTRVFSVRMWYHYAFLAISVAMFGMTVGALIIHLVPHRFPKEQVKQQMAWSSIYFAVSIVMSWMLQLFIPMPRLAVSMPFFSMAATYILSAVPFVFGGMCICLALTRFPVQVSRLYASDLMGAATGCLLLISVLKVANAPTVVILVGFLAGAGAFCFARETGSKSLKRCALLVSLLLGVCAAVHGFLVATLSPILHLGGGSSTPLYEKWNSFSRVTVNGRPNGLEEPRGGAISPAYPGRPQVRQLRLTIDGVAETVLTGFDGDLSKLDFLKYDLVNLAHVLRRDAKVLVIGAGGGRDVLSALVFDQKAVIAVEINENIIRAVTQRFREFTGHLDRHPRVTFVNDEARSYIARSRDSYDIIQVSMIDTWAATTAGSFVLAENSLYTLEAWRTFLDHLAPDGILAFTRWYVRDRPGEMYRITALAATALKGIGAEAPRNHIAIVRRILGKGAGMAAVGKGILLVCKQPFSEEDIATLEATARDMQFELVVTPLTALDSNFATLASGQDLESFTRAFPINITPPTDDKPFFFNMLRLRDAFQVHLWQQSLVTFNMKAVHVLTVLLITVLVLTLFCILLPLILTTERSTLAGAAPLLVFFAAIGFGFMLIEISQMQRLIVFLGHPSYGLSVVLFAMLLASGLGSYLTRNVGNPGLKRSGATRLLLLLCVLVIFGLATPYVIHGCTAAVTPIRIILAAAILFPLGLLMGMAFPLGMKVASGKSESLTPWLWGINGATSVSASVLAVAIALGVGISASFWTGFCCYLVAFLAFLSAGRNRS